MKRAILSVVLGAGLVAVSGCSGGGTDSALQVPPPADDQHASADPQAPVDDPQQPVNPDVQYQQQSDTLPPPQTENALDNTADQPVPNPDQPSDAPSAGAGGTGPIGEGPGPVQLDCGDLCSDLSDQCSSICRQACDAIPAIPRSCVDAVREYLDCFATACETGSLGNEICTGETLAIQNCATR